MQLPRQRRHTRRMAVPKESTFPPILQTYSPGVKATGRAPKPLSQCKATTPGIRFLLEEEKAKKRSVKEKGRAVLPLKDERELELKRKRAKVSESALVQYFSSTIFTIQECINFVASYTAFPHLRFLCGKTGHEAITMFDLMWLAQISASLTAKEADIQCVSVLFFCRKLKLH